MPDNHGVTDEESHREVVVLSRQATQLDWLHAYELELPEPYPTCLGFEAEARSRWRLRPAAGS